MTGRRVVYDTMVFFQWAALRPGSVSGTSRAVETDRVQLCVSNELLDEVGQLLARPAIRAKQPHLTDDRVRDVLQVVAAKADLVAAPASAFSHSAHRKDDHVFNLAIAAHADYLVTWESRHLEMRRSHPQDFRRLLALAPRLRIVDPPSFLRVLADDGETARDPSLTPERPRPSRAAPPPRGREKDIDR